MDNKLEMHRQTSFGKTLLIILGLFVLLIAVLLLSFMFGTKTYSITTIYQAIFEYQDIRTHNIIRDIRMPRELAALLVGMSLAVSGAVMQGVTKNPLADPALIGLNSGAGLGISILFALMSGPSFMLTILAGFLGAIVGGAIVLFLGMTKRGGFNIMRVILAGAAVSSLLSALSQGILIYFKINQSSLLWTSGGVVGTTWQHIKYGAPIIFSVTLFIIIIGHQLTILSLGEEMAQGLGVNLTRIRIVFSVLTMILAGVAVALAGSIAFVGLMIPHIARMLVGVDYRKLLPVTTLLGGIFLVGADTLARVFGESPVSAIVAIIGVPFFIYLVRKLGMK